MRCNIRSEYTAPNTTILIEKVVELREAPAVGQVLEYPRCEGELLRVEALETVNELVVVDCYHMDQDLQPIGRPFMQHYFDAGCTIDGCASMDELVGKANPRKRPKRDS